MPWIRLKGVEGLVYEPECDNKNKKHPCADCFSCQWCSDVRCEGCRNKKSVKRGRTRKKDPPH